MKKILLIIFTALFFIFSVSCSFAETGWTQQLRFMTGPAGGSWFALGDALSEVWNNAGLPQTTTISGGGISNILNVHAKRGDLGFSVTSLLSAALKGEADFKGRRVNNAVIMSNLYTQYTYFLMRKDFAAKNKINSVEDIINKKIPVRFATLRPGTSSEFIVKALFDKGYGLDYRKIFQEWGGSLEYASYEGGADLIAGNHVDCFAFSVGKTASIIKNIENRLDIVILQVGENALEKLSDAYGTVTFKIEPGIYKSLTEGSEPIATVGDYTCIVVRKDLPENLVYELNKIMWENKEKLAASVNDITELEPSAALPEKIPAHNGSVKFWNTLKN